MENKKGTFESILDNLHKDSSSKKSVIKKKIVIETISNEFRNNAFALLERRLKKWTRV